MCKANPEEYFLLGLKDCNDEQRRQFVTDKFLYRTMGKYASRKKHDEEIEDKYNFYVLAKDFFRRKVMKIVAECDYPAFEEMALQLRHLILKPLDASMGRGIRAVSISTKEQANEEFKQMLMGGVNHGLSRSESDSLNQWPFGMSRV